MRKLHFMFLIMVVLLTGPSEAWAQAATEYYLNEAVKVAQRRDEMLHSAMPSFKLDTAQLKRTATTDLANALRHIAGINVKDYGGAGGLKTVSVRGIGAAHTTICYDGLPMAATQSGMVDISAFAFDRIKALRLDIGDAMPLLTPVRTLSAATLYINTMDIPSQNALNVQLKTGSWELINPAISVSRCLNKDWTIGAASQFYFRNNNYSFHIENGALSEKTRRNNSRVRSSVNELWMNGKIAPQQKVQAKIYYAYSNNNLPGAVVLYNNSNHEAMKDATWFVQSRYEGKWRATTLQAAVKLQGQTTVYTDNDPQYPVDALKQRYRQHEYYATIGVEQSLSESWRVAYAADYTFNTLATHLATADGARRHNLQQAVSLRFEKNKWWLTGRMVAHDVWNHLPRKSGQAARNMHRLQPSVSGAYRFLKPQLTLRAFYKDYYRQPTFAENYFYHLGTPQLKPERTQQAGVGLTWKGKHRGADFYVVIDGYYNSITDKITSVPYNLFVWRTENRGKVIIKGLDATLRANFPIRERQSIHCSINYSLQHGADRTDKADLSYGKQPPYLPRHSGAMSVAWENEWINLMLGVTAASERWATINHAPQTQLPGYAELNAAITRDFPCRKGVVTAGLFINNALDKSYEIVRRYPMPLRNYMFSLKWKI